MDLRQLAFLPLRVTVAATQTTLALGHFVSPQGPLLREGGYAAQLSKIIADDGLLNQLNRLLEDEHGPIGLAYTLAELTAEDRPIGKALARDGLLDRMASEEGPFIRLLEAGGPLDRALAEDGALYRFLEPGCCCCLPAPPTPCPPLPLRPSRRPPPPHPHPPRPPPPRDHTPGDRVTDGGRPRDVRGGKQGLTRAGVGTSVHPDTMRP